MKKLFAVSLMILLVVGALFAGAGGQQSGSSGSFRADVFWYSFSDTFLASVRNAMTAEFGKAGIEHQHHDCNNSQTTQAQMIQTAINRGTRVLIVNIVTTGSEDASMNIVEMARKANIPLIWFNREVSNNTIRAYPNSVFVGTDADEAGYMQGQGIARFLLKAENWTGSRSKYDLNGDGNISYVMFRGEHGNAEAFGRTKYSIEEANRLLGGRVRLVPSPANQTSTQYANDGVSNFFLYGNWSAAEAANLMRTALTAHSLTSGAIELIVANNDDQGLGAIEAMNEQGFNTGRAGAGYIPVFGVDATTVAQEAIRAGRMTGSVLQDAVGMATTIVSFVQNVQSGVSLLHEVDRYNMDRGVAKVRVPYALFE